MSNQIKYPRPGDKWEDGVCVASGWINDDNIGVLYIQPVPGTYYVISEYMYSPVGWKRTSQVATHENIVPAARDFNDIYAFWFGN